MTVPVPAGNHPVSAVVTSPGRAVIAAQVSLASGRANMGNVTGTLPVANGGTGATNAEDARDNLGVEPVVPMTTDQVDAVMDDDESIVSDNVVNGTVFSYIWGKLKAWAAAAFAPASHTHTQSQISDMPISVANGGTGSTTASDARTSLGITPANIGAAPATHNHSGQALTPASVAATGAVSGSSVSDSVGSLASLRESVSQTITTGLVVHKLANWCIVILSGYTVTSSGSEAAGSIGFNVPYSVIFPVAVEGVGPGWLNIRTDGSMTLYNESMGGYLTGTVHGSGVIPLK